MHLIEFDDDAADGPGCGVVGADFDVATENPTDDEDDGVVGVVGDELLATKMRPCVPIFLRITGGTRRSAAGD